MEYDLKHKLSKYLLGALLEAIIRDDFDIVGILISLGADPNGCEDKHSITPLHFACTFKSALSAEILLKNGANINARDREGLSPYDMAVEANDPGFLKIFKISAN
jgi:ankyrin repeat protein